MQKCLGGTRLALVALLGLVFASVASGQSITEFSAGISPSAAPLGITTGSDGNLWFAENGANRVARITPSGVVTEFGAGIAGMDILFITAGPDGNLWFTETTSDQIGRMTPSGVVTEFNVGISPSSQLLGITAGPDGNVWFAEFAGNRIGRITPAGVVTEFSTGISPFSGPFGITAGPDRADYPGRSRHRVQRRHHGRRGRREHHGRPRRQPMVRRTE